MRKKRFFKRLFQNLAAWLLSIVIIVPFLIVLVNSFKSQGEAYLMDFTLPEKFLIENYQTVIERGHLLKGFVNSFSYAFFSTILVIIAAFLAAFVAARAKRRSVQIIYYFLIAGIALPVNNITLMRVMSFLGLLNTRIGIIILYAAMAVPISFFISHGFVTGIPRELDEAAVIDGCGPWGLFSRVICPLMKPVAATLFVLNFMGTWNDFTMAIYYLNGSDKMPVTLAVYNFFGQYTQSWNLVCADIILTVLPVLVVYVLGQKYIVSGMTSGAVKG